MCANKKKQQQQKASFLNIAEPDCMEFTTLDAVAATLAATYDGGGTNLAICCTHNNPASMCVCVCVSTCERLQIALRLFICTQVYL